MTKQAHEDGNLPKEYDIKTIMDTWTLQMGYPVVDVVINDDGSATLSQVKLYCNYCIIIVLLIYI